jgi:hypothetical protein
MQKKLFPEQYTTWLDKASFPVILGVWLAITILFGCIYHYFTSDVTQLVYTKDHTTVNNIVDSIYFSFVSATTTGFGDIVPIGWFKLVSIVQVIICWMLLAVVTSKLVSIKQDVILTELYDISFKERINRLRSALLLFRQSIDRITTGLEEKEFKHKELKLVNSYITTFDYTLGEVKVAIDSNKSNKYTKDLDAINIEILFNSTLNSFEKITEMLSLLDKEKIDWKKDVSIGLLSKAISSADALFSSLENSGLQSETVNDLKTRENFIKEKLRAFMFD